MTFDQFKKNHGKVYATPEEASNRQSNFERNLAKLRENTCKGCGVTSYFDLSD